MRPQAQQSTAADRIRHVYALQECRIPVGDPQLSETVCGDCWRNRQRCFVKPRPPEGFEEMLRDPKWATSARKVCKPWQATEFLPVAESRQAFDAQETEVVASKKRRRLNPIEQSSRRGRIAILKSEIEIAEQETDGIFKFLA
jgi:hypothetical protein